MRALTKLLLSLALIASLALAAFLVELLYILYYRRKLRRASSRVEPAASPESPEKEAADEDEVEEVVCELARWRASRVLYTIKEEEREDADSDLEKGIGPGSDKEEAETPFYTPVSSPRTPTCV